jgi:hypothetical protein
MGVGRWKGTVRGGGGGDRRRERRRGDHVVRWTGRSTASSSTLVDDSAMDWVQPASRAGVKRLWMASLGECVGGRRHQHRIRGGSSYPHLVVTCCRLPVIFVGGDESSPRRGGSSPLHRDGDILPDAPTPHSLLCSTTLLIPVAPGPRWRRLTPHRRKLSTQTASGRARQQLWMMPPSPRLWPVLLDLLATD